MGLPREGAVQGGACAIPKGRDHRERPRRRSSAAKESSAPLGGHPHRSAIRSAGDLRNGE
jgi:hypothetical protein